jgi:sigma-B regulation protein RsbU (phosphoserine phosphatase)
LPLNGKSTVISCIFSLEEEVLDFDKSNVIHESGIAILLSSRGTILYHTDHELIGENYSVLKDCFPLDYYEQIPEILKVGNGEVNKIRTNCSEKKKVVVVSWAITEIESVMLLMIPRAEVLGRLNKVMILLVGLSLFGIGIITTITLLLIRYLVSPISRLADDTKKIMAEEGEVFRKHHNEVDVLAGGMERLKERVDTIQNKWIETHRDKEAIDKELELARDIEKSFIPKFPLYPDRNDFICYADLIPARMVGGDMFDIFLQDENRLVITICDTLGKGIPAAMFSVMTRSLIRNIAGRNYSVSEIVSQLNDELSGDGESGMFVTVFLSILDLSNGELSFCNAGHTHPFIVSSSGKVKELSKSHGIPVGAMNSQIFGESKITLKRGDLLLGYTDGVTEECDQNGNLYGVDRLREEIEKNIKNTPKELIESIMGSVGEFRGHSDQRDDISLVSVRYNGDK